MCIDAKGVCNSCSRMYDDLPENSVCPSDDCLSNGDDADAYFNCIDSIAIAKHGVSAVDLVEESDAAIHSLQASFSNNENPEEALMKVRGIQAQELWQKLGDIPVNEKDEIEESFLQFAAGTDKHEIWYWFESDFNLSVAKDLMGI